MFSQKNRLTFSGKAVYYALHLEKDVALLKKAADKGYYHPVMAMKQIVGLSTGPGGKSNVVIPNQNDSRVTSFHMYHVYLPGIRATVERMPSDRLIITELGLSDSYEALEGAGDKSGVYSVTRAQGKRKPEVEYRADNSIAGKEGRVVVIADAVYDEVQSAAADVASRLEKTVGRALAKTKEFDIVYTALNKGFGGMRSYDPMAISSSRIFADKLAQAMIKTQKSKVDTIHWVSEFGGSAIFTQAMDVVTQHNVSFADKNHTAYMYKPTTNPRPAAKLAHQLGFEIGNDFVKASGPRVLISTLMTKASRARNKDDQYSWGDYGKDLAKNASGGLAISGAGLYVAGLFTPAGGAVATAGLIVSGIGAAQLGITKALSMLEKG